MTGFALHGSPITVEHVPGRLFQVLAPPALGRSRLTEIRQGVLPYLLLELSWKIVRIPHPTFLGYI
ncbi:metal ABC transporter, ATP-binding protein [Leptospira ryugenii]|uniref:Metal ABC transporter, ATP-binding protein n=2 Tax=Leptospira ryugenii TaxID=1917863 RepID=A0A2P2E282_9LEPT|nr:metal ABC transporter, ATP-binding protein [Leptospira ryugenii]